MLGTGLNFARGRGEDNRGNFQMSHSHSLPLKSQGEHPSDGGTSASKPSRLKIVVPFEDSDKKIVFLVENANKRLKDVEICVPIVYGTIAFYLGRKTNESQSRK